MADAENDTILPFKKDKFGGAIVSSLPASFSSPSSSELFAKHLTESVAFWQKEGIRGVWITTNPAQHSHLLHVLLSNSFTFHHANAEKAVLTRWLPSAPSTLPSFATHYIGAGGLVFHPSEPYSVLVISEKHEKTTRLKVPGGLLDYGESILEGAKREVMEETGIECDDSNPVMLSMRDRQDAPFGCSDLYIIVVLTAKSTNIKRCEVEIALAEFRDLREVLKDENIYPANKAMFHCALQIAEERKRQKGEGEGEGEGVGFRMQKFPGFYRPEAVYNIWTSKSLKEHYAKQSAL